MMIFVPGTESGVLLMSKFPNGHMYTNRFG